MVRWAFPNNSRTDNLKIMSGTSIDLLDANTCKDYVSEKKKNAQHKEKVLKKFLRIYHRILEKKLLELKEFQEWLENYKSKESFIIESDTELLEDILKKYSNSKNPENIFLKELDWL